MLVYGAVRWRRGASYIRFKGTLDVGPVGVPVCAVGLGGHSIHSCFWGIWWRGGELGRGGNALFPQGRGEFGFFAKGKKACVGAGHAAPVWLKKGCADGLFSFAHQPVQTISLIVV